VYILDILEVLMFPENRNVRIGGAVLAGLLIILGALYLRESQKKEQSSGISVVSEDASNNSYVPYEDINKDDWEQVLQDRTRSVSDVTTISGEGELSNTLTDSFARDFFEDYIRNTSSGALTAQNTDVFLDASLASVSGEATNDYYTKADISTGPATIIYLRTYGNSIAGIIQAHSTQEESEIEIFERAVQSEDSEDLESLNAFLDIYDTVIAQTLLVAAPPALTDQHLGLINSYLAVRNNIEGMLYVFDDPLYATLRIARFESDLGSLYTALSDIYTYIYQQGIRYTDTEPGSMFKLN